jgi:hypothetical protein
VSYSKYSGRVFLVLLPLMLHAQQAQENAVPLKNWTTPLYWQPNQAERESAAPASPQRAAPQLVFSTNAVSTNALTFVAVTPCRLVDTRGGAFNGLSPFSGPSIAAKGTVTFPVQSTTEATADTEPAPCGLIPTIAQAYSFNLTVVPHAGGAVDYVSLWPAGGTQPFVATLNDPQGAIAANAAIVPAGTPSGGISVYNDGPASTDVVIDMNGFFAAPSDLKDNTAAGAGTLASNTTGSENTAIGSIALNLNTTGSENTASGYGALYNNVGGSGNTADGALALGTNTSGFYNTAIGYVALEDNTTGTYNTATGYQALEKNTIGYNNAASGAGALQVNTTGYYNAANGTGSLSSNTTGYQNTASGQSAMQQNTTGNSNTATGYEALYANTTGGNNIAIGSQAAFYVSPGNSNNIHIGSFGAAGDDNVITIGSGQTITKIAGIYGESIESTNLQVCIDTTARLGTGNCSGTPSSRRFKEQIADMGDSSSKLLQLRPVTFLYKPQYDDGSHTLQYGLIAEEVATLYPEMVGYDKDGRPSSLKYQALTPMLLNEVQKQAQQIRSLEDRLAAMEASRPATPEPAR